MKERAAARKHGKLGQWAATAICGNDITSSCLYVSALSILYAGKLAPVALLLVVGLQSLDEGAHVALHEFIQRIQVQAYAVVGAAVLGEIVSADALRSVAAADHRLTRGCPGAVHG